jgi:serine/threonine-protein kinase HipA
MPTSTKQLFVFANLDGDWAPCGRLELTEDGSEVMASNFAYGLRYLERGNAIEVDPVSLSLNDRAAVREKMLFPANGLPVFGSIRDAAPDAWGRRVIEAKLKVPANSLPESQYLLHAGSDRVGALDVRQTLQDAPRPGLATWNSLQYLVEAAERIEEGRQIPANLEMIFQDGTALGGARPKASIRDEEEVLWLAKFSSRNDAFNIPMVECCALRLASEAELTVPPLQYITLGTRPVMLIRRFDRFWATPEATAAAPLPDDLMATAPVAGLVEKRMPFASGLTLLGCDESESRTKSYGDLAGAIRRYCHPAVIRDDNRQLFSRMVYNIFVSNDDDHLRNHGFLWDLRLRGWRLSPLYDVLPRPSVAFERQLHLGVGPQGRAATLDNAFAAREMFTLSPADAASAIATMWAKVREWRVYFESYGATPEQIDRVAPAFRHIDDVSTPELRRSLP